METRVCKVCRRYKPLTEFYRDHNTYRTTCKECERVQAKEYRMKVKMKNSVYGTGK